MNKQQLREAIANAIQYADEQDVVDQQRPRKRGYYERKWDRLNAFLTGLQVKLGTHDSEVQTLINDFQSRVIHEENPLLDAADSNKEKPE